MARAGSREKVSDLTAKSHSSWQYRIFDISKHTTKVIKPPLVATGSRYITQSPFSCTPPPSPSFRCKLDRLLLLLLLLRFEKRLFWHIPGIAPGRRVANGAEKEKQEVEAKSFTIPLSSSSSLFLPTITHTFRCYCAHKRKKRCSWDWGWTQELQLLLFNPYPPSPKGTG